MAFVGLAELESALGSALFSGDDSVAPRLPRVPPTILAIRTGFGGALQR